MARQNPIKPLLLAYLKAKNTEELHEALDYLLPSRIQMRYLISEIKKANRDTIALESWCLKQGYTGAETTTGKKERPRKGMSKLYKTQYLKVCDEWLIRLPVSPLLENLDTPNKKTNVVVIWQEDRIIVTLPVNFMLSMRPNAVEHPEVPPELLPPKKKKKQKINRIVWTLASGPERRLLLEKHQKEKEERRKQRALEKMEQAVQKDLEDLKEMAQRSVIDDYATSPPSIEDRDADSDGSPDEGSDEGDSLT